MNVKFLNPFVEAAYEVLKQETGDDISRGELRLETGTYSTDDVTVILSLVGAVEGTVLYSMPNTTAINVASRLMGETFQMLEELAQSGIAELGNVITGRASMKLADAGFEANISPPSLIMGRGATLSTLGFPRLVVPLILPLGSILIHLALREGAAKNIRTPQLAIPKPFDFSH